MFCPNCGTKLEEGAVFCTNCGTRVEDSASQAAAKPQEEASNDSVDAAAEAEAVNTNIPEENSQGSQPQNEEAFYQQPEKGKKFLKKNFRGIIGAVAAIVAVILIVKIVASLFSGTPDSVIAVYDEENEVSTIYLNSKKVADVDGEAGIYYNMDKSAFYILDGEDTAYYLKGKKLQKVMSGCQEIIIANHDEAALLVDEDDVLSRYNGSKLEEISDEEVAAAAISGDGKNYAYTIYDDDYESVTYIGSKPGKETKVKDVVGILMSENGDYLYGSDDEYNLVSVSKKGETTTLGKDIDNLVGLNEDGTEIMFVSDGKTYVSVKGKEKVKVSGGEVMLVTGKESDSVLTNYFYPVKTFKKTVAYVSDDGDYDICLLSGKYEAEKIVGGVSTICGVNDDASKVYYIDGSDLYYAKVKKDAKGKELAGDVSGSSVWMSDDCKDIYYVDDDGRLCYIKGTGKGKTVDDDLEMDSYSMSYVIDGALYTRIDEELYYVKGRKAKALKDVEGIQFDASSDRVYAYDDDKAYEVKKGKMKKLKGDFESIDTITVKSYGLFGYDY